MIGQCPDGGVLGKPFGQGGVLILNPTGYGRESTRNEQYFHINVKAQMTNVKPNPNLSMSKKIFVHLNFGFDL